MSKSKIHQIPINPDKFITLGQDEQGFFSETYIGQNYIPSSNKRSYSRIHRGKDFKELLSNTPKKYHDKLLANHKDLIL